MGRCRMAPPAIPPVPGTAERSDDLSRRMLELADMLHQRNLNHAVELAQQAARGEGELVEHFAELGRLYHHRMRDAQAKARTIEGHLSQPTAARSARRTLRAIEGGRS